MGVISSNCGDGDFLGRLYSTRIPPQSTYRRCELGFAYRTSYKMSEDMQFASQIGVFSCILALGLLTGAWLVSAGSPNLLALLATGLAVSLIGVAVVRPRWRKVTSRETCTGAFAGNSQAPGLASTILFLLILTGPPRIRFRDPTASLRGELDAVVVFHIVVWVLGGVWVLYEMWRYSSLLHSPFRFWLPQKLGILLLLCLGLSAFVSQAPLLTLFKVYQMGVMLLLGFFFVRRYGPKACLQRLFWGYTVLLIGAGIFALWSPSVAFRVMQSAGGLRLRVDQITLGLGPVAIFAIILLLTIAPPLPRILYLLLLAMDVIILVFSFTRSAYLCLLVFLALALVTRARAAAPRRLAYLSLAAILLLLVAGVLPRIAPWLVREPESLDTLTGRTGLWAYLAEVTFRESPWIGLGYWSASRIYALQYHPSFGTAHSSFVEVLLGGGLLSVSIFTLLWLVLLLCAASLLRHTRDRYAFAACSLLFSVFLVSQVGEGIDPGGTGFTFWCLLAILPSIRDRLAIDCKPRACQTAKSISSA